MSKITYILIIATVLMTPIKGITQKFDSLHVYAISMTASYHITIDKDLIKNEIDPIVIKNSNTIDSINIFFQNVIKGKFIKNLKSYYIDLRLSFEFFKNGNVIKTIGITPYNEMFIEKKLYVYKREKLKPLNKYISNLSGILNVK